jgi:hypothetical protein
VKSNKADTTVSIGLRAKTGRAVAVVLAAGLMRPKY